MAYIITGDTLGLAIGPVSETANDVHEALDKARQMYETGLVNVSIGDEGGHKIGGEDLLACMTGKKDDHQRSSGEIDFAIISRTRYCRRCSVIGIPWRGLKVMRPCGSIGWPGLRRSR